ncbi:hypothetical protein N7457_001528 [Penicillium paradoxum]|uniref:uncharacterized protein n=1 Tax=Penicillium paradoxum TaxID=176176 RepID=UPI0025499AC6|nr:uncharacterized protein N7457_001528 [Penicillium paradoxum]KAJ5794929.1 hypothetical protein N7457_001528 [Penicillium paradoxum]
MPIHAMSNKFSTTETVNERQNQSPLLQGWHFNRLDINASMDADAMSSPLTSRVRSMVPPFSDGMSVLAPTADFLSTGAPRMVPQWWVCCGCDQMVNPNLASEDKCPICAHSKCPSCKKEEVR